MLTTFKHRYYNITGIIQRFFIILTNVNIMSEENGCCLTYFRVYIIENCVTILCRTTCVNYSYNIKRDVVLQYKFDI